MKKRPVKQMYEQMGAAYDRQFTLMHHLGIERLPYLRAHGGHWGDIGTGLETNSGAIIRQIMFALAANSHPNVSRLIQALEQFSRLDESYHAKVEQLLEDLLIKPKIFQGVRVLDLGCGDVPAFARVLRAMGAEAHTVDRISADEMSVCLYKGGFDQHARDLEVRNHICCDMGFPESLELIAERTGGNFDLVSAVHIDNAAWYDFGKKELPLGLRAALRELVPKVLRKFGIFYPMVVCGQWACEIFCGDNVFAIMHWKPIVKEDQVLERVMHRTGSIWIDEWE